MSSIPTYTTIAVIVLTTLWLIRKWAAGGVCNIKKDLTGQVVIVTGANTGIGRATTKRLAELGATIVLACRSADRTNPVIEELKKQTGNKKLEFIKLDLSDLSSIREFVIEFKKRHQELNILINNAGINFANRKLTKDGFEAQFGTNHLGHHYLTTLLLDVIKKSKNSRIVTVSSSVAEFGNLNWDDLMAEKSFAFMTTYSLSKVANVLFTKELQKRLEGTKVLAVSLHPGIIYTEMSLHIFDNVIVKTVFNLITRPFCLLLGKTIKQGAQTTLYCALEDNEKLKGGAFYADCKLKKIRNEAQDEIDAKRLWEVSENLISSKVKN